MPVKKWHTFVHLWELGTPLEEFITLRWTHGLVEVQNKKLDWAFQVHMYAYAHHFDLKLNRNTFEICISKYCFQLPENTSYDKTGLNPFIAELFQNPFHNGFFPSELLC